MLKRINPQDRPAPAQFAQATLVEAATTLLFTSGQVGTDKDGTLPEDIEGQTANAWESVMRCLEAAGTSSEHLVQVTAYLTRSEDIAAYRKVRSEFIPDVTAPSTLLIVSGLADPRFLVEVEVTAAVPQHG